MLTIRGWVIVDAHAYGWDDDRWCVTVPCVVPHSLRSFVSHSQTTLARRRMQRVARPASNFIQNTVSQPIEREKKRWRRWASYSAPGRAESQRAGNGTASPPWRGQLCMHSDSAATSECPVSPPIQPAQRSWISPLLLRGPGTTRGPIEDTLHAARTQYIHRTRARHAAGELVARGLIMRSGDEG